MSVHPLEFPDRLLSAYQQPDPVSDGTLFASRTYRELKDNLPEDNRAGWEKMLEYNSFLSEASLLLQQLQETKKSTIHGKIKVIEAESLHKRLQNLENRISNFESAHHAQLESIRTATDAKVLALITLQDETLKALNTELADSEQKVPKKSEKMTFVKAWGNPIVGRSFKIAEIAFGLSNRIMSYVRSLKNPTTPTTPPPAPGLKTPSAKVSFSLSLASAAASLAIVVPNTIHDLIQVVKQLNVADKLKKELKGLNEQIPSLDKQILNFQNELILLRINAPKSDWTQHISRERERLVTEQDQLIRKRAKIEKKLTQHPVKLMVTILFAVTGFADMAGRVLDVVTVTATAGAKIGSSVMTGIGVASQVLSPIVAGLQLLITGGFLTLSSKKLHEAKKKNIQLRENILRAREKMNPQRAMVKSLMQKIRADLALKKHSEPEKMALKEKLEQLRVDYDKIKVDVVEQFYELEADRLQMELLANNRQIGHLRLSVATFSILTFASTIGVVSAISGGFTTPVGIVLTATAMTLVAVGLVLAIVQKVKANRSAKTLLVQQAPYRQESKEQWDQTAKSWMEGNELKVPAGKEAAYREMWELIQARIPKTESVPFSSFKDPEFLEGVFKEYFKNNL